MANLSKRARTALVCVAAVAVSGTGGVAAGAGAGHAADSALARDLATLDRSATWTNVATLNLPFPTYHPEGIVVTPDRIYISSTQVIEPTVKYPDPVDGFDRTPGKGIGHLFVISTSGELIEDVVLGHDIVYHPGGIDFDGRYLWIPVAQYRPNSSAEIDRVDTRTLAVTPLFEVPDHIGGVVLDRSTGHVVGNNWGSRTFYEWTQTGRLLASWRNPEDFVDLQDCQYVPVGKMACGGVTNLPQTPAAGGSTATFELGGLVLMDLRSHEIVNDVPFQQWSAAGHVMTRNPVKLAVDGNTLTMWAAPDNGDEGVGTQVFTWQTTMG